MIFKYMRSFFVLLYPFHKSHKFRSAIEFSNETFVPCFDSMLPRRIVFVRRCAATRCYLSRGQTTRRKDLWYAAGESRKEIILSPVDLRRGRSRRTNYAIELRCRIRWHVHTLRKSGPIRVRTSLARTYTSVEFSIVSEISCSRRDRR